MMSRIRATSGGMFAVGVAIAALSLSSTPALAQASGSSGFAMSDFALKTAQDLYDVCTVDPADSNYEAATAFCYGYFTGGKHFHDEVSLVEGFAPVACAGGTATRRDLVETFVLFMRNNPAKAGERPMNAAIEAIAQRWPCPNPVTKSQQ